jgi:WD40 repeat protein
MSYSRENANLQMRVIAGLWERGVNVWVDVENFIPGSQAWEREIERAIPGAAGVIVLLSPESNNSEWVRREISFAEQNAKRIFPVLVSGDEDDSIPLRLSSHQRVDLRRNFNDALDELANARKEHLGMTAVHRIPRSEKQSTFDPASLRKILLAGVIAVFGITCLGGAGLAASLIYNNIMNPTKIVTTPLDIDPTDPVIAITETPVDIVNAQEPTGKIAYTCQVAGDEICIINADGSGWRLTNMPSGSNYANPSADWNFVLFVGRESGSTETYEINLNTDHIKQLTNLGVNVGAPEVSPDNQFIIFTYRSGDKNSQVWIMNWDGSDPHPLYSIDGKHAHDATWSPDGSQILFASGRGDDNKL